jgi:amino-acid N-acetyltransferase
VTIESKPPLIQVEIRAATAEDLPSIQTLLKPFVEARKIMRRTRAEQTALLVHGFVAVDATMVVGFSAIEIYSKKLGEIQCLAVAETHQSHGIGARLVHACVERAREMKVMEVMAISSSEDFLAKIGFNYALPDQKRALFFQLRSREEVYREAQESDGDD